MATKKPRAGSVRAGFICGLMLEFDIHAKSRFREGAFESNAMPLVSLAGQSQVKANGQRKLAGSPDNL